MHNLQKKSLFIRADAGGVLGTGHVMRMIALAQAFQKLGGGVVLATSSCPEMLADRLSEMELNHKSLETNDYGSNADLSETKTLADQSGSGWIVLDGYHFRESFQKGLVEADFKVLCVDDYGHCDEWYCDALLNQNLGSETWGEPISHRNPFSSFLGADFALLREEFQTIEIAGAQQTEQLERILITLGGADSNNATGAILNLLEKETARELQIRVLVGAGNPNRALLENWNSRHQIELIVNASDMPAQFSWAQGVICAGGSTCWEVLRYGLPSAVVTIAENQVPVVAALREQRLSVNLGWEDQLTTDPTISEKLSSWLNAPGKLLDLKAVRSVIDGQGANRVAHFLMHGLTLRDANEEDLDRYFEWANDPAVRQNALNTEPIQREDHERWFPSRVESSSAHLFVAEKEGVPVGQVRFERKEDGRYLLGYSIVAAFRGKNLGSPLLDAGCDRLACQVPSGGEILAEVRTANLASQNALKRAGFQLLEETEELSSFVKNFGAA